MRVQEELSLEGGDPDMTSLSTDPKGVYITRLAVFIYALVTVLIASAVGLIVHFAQSRHPCDYDAIQSCQTFSVDAMTSSTPSVTSSIVNTSVITLEEDLWQICLNLSRVREETLLSPMSCCYQDKQPTVYRLPKTFYPTHYDIELIPDIYTGDPATFSYNGSAKIHLQCRQTANIIHLHNRDMVIEQPIVVADSNGGVIDVAGTETGMVDLLKIHLAREVISGENITVSISYHGNIKRDMMGLYYSTYVVNNQTKYMLSTQLEPTDARKLFPCLDEPWIKSTFRMTVWRKEPLVALTNMPLIRSESQEDGWFRDHFQVTPVVMSTYLCAVVIAEYTYIQGVASASLTNKTLRHWSRPDYIERGMANYSMKVSVAMFDYFENYFNFPFDLPKEDQITVPDFDSGAMENWGLITYREIRLLYDPEHVTEYEKQRAVGTIAHELLHQWLGNIITCAWWSDLWLNEGMARYHQHLAMQHAEPNWDVDQVFATQVTFRAMSADQHGHSHPVHNPVNDTIEIDEMFDTITYDKAACLIRMVHRLILGDSYKTAIQEYLQRHKYGSANFTVLLQIWDDRAKQDGINLEQNITATMITWLMQMGYPFVTLEKINRTTIRLSQRLFLQNPSRPLFETYASPFSYRWNIPVSMVTKKNPDKMTIEWLHQNNRSIELVEPLSEGDWILCNYQQLGFYRVNYDAANWELLIKQLNTDHQVFDVISRGQLVQDSFELARSGYLDHVTSLKLTEYLGDETEYVPWFAAAEQNFAFLYNIFKNNADFNLLRTYIRRLLTKQYDRLGWQAMPNDRHHDIYLRDLILTHACRYDHKHCIDTAMEYYRKWKQDPQNVSIIPPDIRDAVYCTAIRHGVREDWDFMFEQYKTFAHFSYEKSRRRKSLSCTTDRSTLTQLFKMACEMSSEIVDHDQNGYIYIMRDVSRNPVGHYVAWEALNTQWSTLPSKFAILATLCDDISTEYDLKKFEDFLASHPTDSHVLEADYDDMKHVMKHHIRWRQDNEDAVFDWLKQTTLPGV